MKILICTSVEVDSRVMFRARRRGGAREGFIKKHGGSNGIRQSSLKATFYESFVISSKLNSHGSCLSFSSLIYYDRLLLTC